MTEHNSDHPQENINSGSTENIQGPSENKTTLEQHEEILARITGENLTELLTFEDFHQIQVEIKELPAETLEAQASAEGEGVSGEELTAEPPTEDSAALNPSQQEELNEAPLDEEPSAEVVAETVHAQLDVIEIQSCIEAVLFMADKPVTAARLKELLGSGFEDAAFDEAMAQMKELYQNMHHGI